MSSPLHVDNKGKDVLILGEAPTQGLDDATFTIEAKYPINFTQSGKWLVLSIQYKGSNCFLFLNAAKVYEFKEKDSKEYALCLDNVSKGVLIFFLLILILLIIIMS